MPAKSQQYSLRGVAKESFMEKMVARYVGRAKRRGGSPGYGERTAARLGKKKDKVNLRLSHQAGDGGSSSLRGGNQN